MIYSKYFDWLISHINGTLDKKGYSKNNKLQLGILDIFGFEIFESNGYE
jgi:myosin-1